MDLDIYTERVPHSGAWIISAWLDGSYLETRTYYGYTESDAVAAFRHDVLGVGVR
jgi:hypothetical protein